MRTDLTSPGASRADESPPRTRRGAGSLFLKRFIDSTVSLLVLVLLSPVLLLAFAAIRVFLGSPVLFRQTRPGLHGAPFRMYKFRTMTDARDEAGMLLPDAERLTAFGLFLRRTSLDELPSLFNVLRGDMSLVGPRPLLMEYLPLYTRDQARRHDVKPGITGLAQVNGRNAISWEQKFTLDTWYVDHQSTLLDLRILAMTFWKVLARHGINQPGSATAEAFRGTPPANDERVHG